MLMSPSGSNNWQSYQATLAKVDVANAKDPYGLLSANFDVALMLVQVI